MQKNILYFVVLIFCALGVTGIFLYEGYVKKSISSSENLEKLKIAVCPTYSNFISSIKSDDFEVIKTNSTAKSLELLKDNNVDYVLSGRLPKPEEGDYQIELISNDGYSFLGSQGRTINKDNLNRESICTDLEVNRIGIDIDKQNFKSVERIAECSNNDIIITSWENTDYGKYSVVHILNNDGSRFIFSRTPILYCKGSCQQNIINQLKIAYEK